MSYFYLFIIHILFISIYYANECGGGGGGIIEVHVPLIVTQI